MLLRYFQRKGIIFMLEKIFRGIFDNESSRVIAPSAFLLCIGVCLLLGGLLALLYRAQERSSRGFLATLALLPAAVCVVIMMVNGNVGAGVAVAGAFSLIRFRSAPGSAREIGAVFLAMGVGIMAGMGYLAYAVLFALLLGGCGVLFSRAFQRDSSQKNFKTLRITIPEQLNFCNAFEDIFKEYTRSCELVQVRTSNMGSLYKLTYDIVLQKPGCEKALMDALRCRNGNLEIMISDRDAATAQL